MNNRFHAWAFQNFPFMEATFKEIDNYHLMMQILHYLKEQLQDYRELVLKVEELENWFKNLDVQEEINNKLEEMVESGELQEIISEYLNSLAIFGFDTVSDMKSATNLINGSYAKTMGYYSKNDSGSSLYKIRTITNEDVVDGGSIIAMEDDTLVAELIVNNGIVNPEQFGCYGDGTTDDTTNFIKVLNYAITNKYKLVGNKSYVINETLVIYSNDYFVMNIKKIINKSNIDILVDIADNYNDITIEELTSDSDSDVAVRLSGIHGHACRYNRLNIKNIIGFGIGLLMYGKGDMGTCYNSIDIGKIECPVGIQLQNYDENDYVNSNYFYNATLDCSDTCIKTINVENGNDFDGNGFMNISLVHYSKAIVLNNAVGNIFLNMRNFEIPSGSLLIDSDELSNNNQFTFNSFVKLNDYNILGNNNFITGRIVSPDSITVFSNNTCFISNNKIFTFDNVRTPSGNTSGKWNDNFDMSSIYQFDPNMVVQFGGNNGSVYTLKLCAECNIISQFYLNKLGSNSINITNVDDTSIASDIVDTGLYLIKHDGTKWICTKL